MKPLTLILIIGAALGLGAWAMADNDDDTCPPSPICAAGSSYDDVSESCTTPSDLSSDSEVDW